MITCHILIVDDDPDDIDLLRSALHEIGVKEVHGVYSMQKAIEFLQPIVAINDLPKLIITDLNMPCHNGYELLKFVKTSPRYLHIPVIVFSTSLLGKEIQTSLALGALEYIPKPVLVEDYIDLAVKIKSLINNGS